MSCAVAMKESAFPAYLVPDVTRETRESKLMAK
jgi:hypothetical protein